MIKNPKLKKFVSIVSVAPLLYLAGLAVSLFLYFIMPWPLVGMRAEPVLLGVGMAFIVLATLLVFWAQGISRKGAHRPTVISAGPVCEDFMRGPYKYMRHPGALGLMIMFAGFVLVVNSLVMAVLLVLFVIAETVWFVPAEEAEYMESCPEAYAEYRRRVRMWL